MDEGWFRVVGWVSVIVVGLYVAFNPSFMVRFMEYRMGPVLVKTLLGVLIVVVAGMGLSRKF
jgi:hypothetical protein